MDIKLLWREVLDENADPSCSFISNGGDSYRAVLATVRAFELWQIELDYLDVLEAPNVESLEKLVGGISSDARS